MVGRTGEQNSPPSVPILIVAIQTCAPKGAVGDKGAARDRKLERVYDVASPLATMWPLETSTVQVFTLIKKNPDRMQFGSCHSFRLATVRLIKEIASKALLCSYRPSPLGGTAAR